MDGGLAGRPAEVEVEVAQGEPAGAGVRIHREGGPDARLGVGVGRVLDSQRVAGGEGVRQGEVEPAAVLAGEVERRRRPNPAVLVVQVAAPVGVRQRPRAELRGAGRQRPAGGGVAFDLPFHEVAVLEVVEEDRRVECRHRAEHVRAGSAEVDAVVPVVGEAREGVVVIGGGYADDVGQRVRAGVARGAVDVRALVPRRGHEQDVGGVLVGDPGQVGRGVRAAAGVARVDDPSAHLVGVADGIDDRALIQEAVRRAGLQRHQADVPVDSRGAGAVVAYSPDRAGHMGAVRVRVVRDRVSGLGGDAALVLDEVPAVDVIDPPVRVVVDVVARCLAGVLPEVAGEVLVAGRDARVDHPDGDAGEPALEVPRGGSLDVRVDLAPGVHAGRE